MGRIQKRINNKTTEKNIAVASMLKNTQKLLFSLALVALYPHASFGDAVKCVAMGTSSSCTHTPATEYQTDWGSQCSGVTVRGVSMCGNYESVSGLSAGEVVETVWRNDDASANRACLCKIVQPVVSKWVYAETNGSAGDCARWCQDACAGKLGGNSDTDKALRRALLGEFYE